VVYPAGEPARRSGRDSADVDSLKEETLMMKFEIFIVRSRREAEMGGRVLVCITNHTGDGRPW
jgi:hypothetical protein